MVGWSDKTKLILISTLVEVVVEVEVELGKSSNIQELIQKRKNLKKQNVPEETIEEIEDKIAEFCQEANRNKVMENFNEVDGADGNIAHHGIWKIKRKIFPKIKPPLPEKFKRSVDYKS